MFQHHPDDQIQLGDFHCTLAELQVAVPEYRLPNVYRARRYDGARSLVTDRYGDQHRETVPWLLGDRLLAEKAKIEAAILAARRVQATAIAERNLQLTDEADARREQLPLWSRVAEEMPGPELRRLVVALAVLEDCRLRSEPSPEWARCIMETVSAQSQGKEQPSE